MADSLVNIVESYFEALRDVHRLGAGTRERSYYPALAELLNLLGQELKPKVLCLSDLGNTGAGHPDFGLFAANQVQKGEPRRGQMPERGVIEMKGVSEDAWFTADTNQVSKYFGAYRLVIVTNLRTFLIIGEGVHGQATKLEGFRLAADAKSFWAIVETPRKSAEKVGRAFGEYLKRATTQSVALREPRDVAWFLASYARDALQRVERGGDLPALSNVRSSLEQALGVTFEAEKGEHFFRSTLVQTLFYGVFSAWALWAREVPRSSLKFDWRTVLWHLTVPFVRTLFQQIASPAHLQPLSLIEVLDWTAATLNRVDADAFFTRFNEADAVQFFYEPFLEAFDPELRKELGVWYTPNEVVTYMVARVDKALREDLGIEEGLASDRVYVLDPCCGTGAFLTAVLRRIEATFEAKGLGGLKGQLVKQAALSRVMGFEIMPAPFVIAHLQVGLALKRIGAPLDGGTERARVFLTNALTGWEPHVTKPLPFPELEEERSQADSVKQGAPILVVIGNPPYNGFAGVTEGKEERALTDAYKRPKNVRKPEGQGLNDLYVRFFRMAERRIVQKLTVEKKDLLSDEVKFHYDDSGEGIVCFISNYSWLDGLSFTAMRERYLEAYDIIRIDCLNGDKYRTGKIAPDGTPDPSVFSTEQNREGIQVGTAIATLIRKQAHGPAERIEFRNLWGAQKRQQLINTAEIDVATLYDPVTPELELGLPYLVTKVGSGFFDWISLVDILPASFPGFTTSRDDFLIATERKELEDRVSTYFDPAISDRELADIYPAAMETTKRFDAHGTRKILLKRGLIKGEVIPVMYRPLDMRWLFWEPDTKLLDERRSDYKKHVIKGNIWIEARKKQTIDEFSRGYVSSLFSDSFGNGRSSFFPLFLSDEDGKLSHTNIAKPLIDHTVRMGVPPKAIFDHVIAILHAPQYRAENLGALRMSWPRIPIPNGLEQLSRSAYLGNALSTLLNPETPAPGVSTGALRQGLRAMGLPTKRGGLALDANDLALTVGWGFMQSGGGGTKVMPGRGLTVTRDYTDNERQALDAEAQVLGITLAELIALVGAQTLDVYLGIDSWWSNIPENVWNYCLGGYQTLKKWLSYRERSVLGRPLRVDEALYFSQTVRRIAAILLLTPALDANYRASIDEAKSYEALGLSRDAARERKEAASLKRGAPRKLTPAMKANRNSAGRPKIKVIE